MRKLLCFGSINIDQVYTVPTIVQSGETISSTQYKIAAGGKGANQSVAMARANDKVETYHAGKIGEDGQWIVDYMKQSGVNTSHIIKNDKEFSGRAVIQLSTSTKDNAIILYPGTNQTISDSELDYVFNQGFGKGDVLIVQNEINATKRAMEVAAQRQMVIVSNPAPCPPNIASLLPFDLVNVLIVNEGEAASLIAQIADKDTCSKATAPEHLVHLFMTLMTEKLKAVIITLGSKGLVAGFETSFSKQDQTRTYDMYRLPIFPNIKPVDTTGAGDTFVGFLISSLFSSEKTYHWDSDVVLISLKRASAAAGLAVQTFGAMGSIPTSKNVMEKVNLEDGKLAVKTHTGSFPITLDHLSTPNLKLQGKGVQANLSRYFVVESV